MRERISKQSRDLVRITHVGIRRRLRVRHGRSNPIFNVYGHKVGGRSMKEKRSVVSVVHLTTTFSSEGDWYSNDVFRFLASLLFAGPGTIVTPELLRRESATRSSPWSLQQPSRSTMSGSSARRTQIATAWRPKARAKLLMPRSTTGKA
jgi:uncharacterized iron-regulated membrane protein